MSLIEIPAPCLLIVSVLSQAKTSRTRVINHMLERLGPLEREVGPLDFEYTDYYEKEMGPGIVRWLWKFERLFHRAFLAEIKTFTNRIEIAYSNNGLRTINLDPGLLSLENFVLATGKNRSHRIYLQKGIFADLTLTYEKGSFRPTPWTYPDYRDQGMIRTLNDFRESHLRNLRRIKKRGD